MEASRLNQKASEVDSRLIPEVNIGVVGHVAHGKTTLTQALTGKLTLTHSEELKRGITIRLGYADVTIYKCTKCGKFSTSEKCVYCFSGTEPQRTVSFIDAPGHETLMATVLSGAGLMDGAILVISAVEKCPQPQTREHLTALEVVGIKNVVIVQTKIDLVSEERAMQSYNEIKNFVKGSILENSPIIPVSAQMRINLDFLLQAIQETMPTPEKDFLKEPKMLVARSFDVNKPGAEVGSLSGGIIGGAIISGKFKVGDKIEISPGMKIGNKYQPIKTNIVGLQKAGKNLDEATAGGLLGVKTQLDPYLTKSDSLVGNVVALSGKAPVQKESLTLEMKLMKRIVGADDFSDVKPIKIGENLLLNVGTARTIGIVESLKKDLLEMKLKVPIAAETAERVVISRMIMGRWRLIGYGNIK